MTIARRSVGSFVNGTGNITPVAGTTSTGDAIIVFTGERIGADTITAPSGWTELSSNTNVHQLRAFGLIATGPTGTDTMPTFNWSASNSGWAIVVVYSGVDSSFSIGGNPSDRTSTHVSDIVCPAVARTPSVNGCLCIYWGERNKTATANGTTFTAPTGFNMVAQQALAGTAYATAICEQIQTTASAIASGIVIPGSVTDTTQTFQGGLFILKPAIAALLSNNRSLLGVGV